MTRTATRFLALTLTLLLAACASKTTTRVTSAAATPLSDLNLVRDEIPDVLQNALKQPYLKPDTGNCPAITKEVQQLDAALGADLDAPASDDGPSLLERGTDMAENTAVGAVQRTAEGLVPFRSWIRKLSGAEKHSRKVAAAITAGSIRRAYLKGVASAQGCVLTPPPQMASASGSATASVPAKSPEPPVAAASSPATP